MPLAAASRRACRLNVTGEQQRSGAGGGGVEQGQALLVLDRDEAAADAGLVGGAQVPGHPGRLGPVAPGQAGGGQAVGVPVGGQGVEEGVGGGVVALAGGAEDPGGRGEQHKPLNRKPRGGLVQVPGSVGLGPQHLVQVGVRESRDRGVGDGPGGVIDRRERGGAGDGGEQADHGGGVGGVAGSDGDRGSGLGEAGGEGGGAGGGGSAAAGEQQPAAPCAARWRATRAPRPPVPPVIRTVAKPVRGERGLERRRPVVGSVRSPSDSQARCTSLSGADGGLGVAVEVDEGDAVWVFALGAGGQAPDGGGGRVGVVVVPGADRAAGEQDQAAGGEPVTAGQPGLDQAAEGRAAGARSRSAGGTGTGDPVQLVQAVVASRARESAWRQRAEGEGRDGGDRLPGRVGGVQR